MTQIINFVKGILIGIAVVIPGLSGSIFAVVVGLYEKMINAVSTFRKNIKKNTLFLLPIVIGAVIGVLLSAKLITVLCEKYPQQSYFFFIGLVIGSIPLVLRKIMKKSFNPAYLIITVMCMGLILLMGYLSNGEASSEAVEGAQYYLTGMRDVIVVLFSGFASCALMTIPGVSGSVTLMVLGQYNTVYGAVSKCTDMLKYIAKGDFQAAGEASKSIWLVLVFAIGGVAGFICISKIVAKLLEKFESQTYYGVGGMIVGAIIILFTEGVMPDKSFTSAFGNFTAGALGMLALDAVLIVIGVVCTLFLDDDSKMAQKARKKGMESK